MGSTGWNYDEERFIRVSFALFGWRVGLNDCPGVNGGWSLHRGVGWFCLHFAGCCLHGFRDESGQDALWEHWFPMRLKFRCSTRRMNVDSTDQKFNVDWSA